VCFLEVKKLTFNVTQINFTLKKVKSPSPSPIPRPPSPVPQPPSAIRHPPSPILHPPSPDPKYSNCINKIWMSVVLNPVPLSLYLHSSRTAPVHISLCHPVRSSTSYITQRHSSWCETTDKEVSLLSSYLELMQTLVVYTYYITGT